MSVQTKYIHLKTTGDADVIDITLKVQEALGGSGLDNGIVTLSVVGSTAALTTCEFEPGLVADLKEIFNKLIPAGHHHHDAGCQDGNGHAHLRSSLVGPSLTLPFHDRALILGTWQQVIFIDFDNRPRERKIVVQILGE